MSVIFEMFIFHEKTKIKANKTFFILEGARQGLTSLLRISIRDGESGLRSSIHKKLFVGW